jgi:hypothetical protein
MKKGGVTSMTVKIKEGVGGATATVVEGPAAFCGWECTGNNAQQAINNLAANVRRAGFQGRITIVVNGRWGLIPPGLGHT